jgi:hypothetical protein
MTSRPLNGIKRTFSITIDRDLHEPFAVWMEQNGYSKGDETAAFKAAIRLVLTMDPITAHLADAKARAYQFCVGALHTKINEMLGEITREWQQLIKMTSPEEINIGRKD